MELCTSRAISSLLNHRLFVSQYHLRSKPSPSLKRFHISRTNPGSLYYLDSSLRATSSEETSTSSSKYAVEEPVAVTTEDRPTENNSYAGTSDKEELTEDSSTDGQTQAFEFLDQLNVKLDSEDTPSLLLLGGGSLIALWVSAVLVGAIDSIPLFPKLMEVVGLAYTLWFGTRYLIFKRNREELAVKIGEIKQQVLGSNED